MNLSKKQIIIIGVVLAIIAIGVFLYMRNSKKKKQKDPFGALTASEADKKKITESQLLESVQKDSNFPLKMGSENARVSQLQKYLIKENDKALPAHGVDGLWGPEVEQEVMTQLGKNEVSKDLFIQKKMYLYV